MSKARSPLGDWSKTVGITDWRRSGIALMVVMPAMISRICDTIYAMEPNDPGQRRHEPVFPGFKEMSDRRKALANKLTARRTQMGLSQTEVAARMGTSQSAVARLESGDADVRLSTLDRYVAALGERLDWGFERGVVRAEDLKERHDTQR
jgi:ribosome-binding protein aMBF1 (putative translation factor)